MKHRYFVLLAIIAFFAVTLFEGSFIVSSQSAQQEYTEQKWEYLVFTFGSGIGFVASSDRALATRLNGELLEVTSRVTPNDLPLPFFLEVIGNDGWELVTSTPDGYAVIFVFKRPEQSVANT
jgi:hypothetical protein